MRARNIVDATSPELVGERVALVSADGTAAGAALSILGHPSAIEGLGLAGQATSGARMALLVESHVALQLLILSRATGAPVGVAQVADRDGSARARRRTVESPNDWGQGCEGWWG